LTDSVDLGMSVFVPRLILIAMIGFPALATGCILTPPSDNPANVRVAECENPCLVAPGEPSSNNYAKLYETVIDVLDDDFDLKPTSRYSGQIETYPRVAPGFEQPWKGGSPSARERFLSTNQSLRQRAAVQISPGDRGGYRVYVEVFKEREDLPVPIGVQSAATTSGIAVFQEAPTVDRKAELLASETVSNRWIPAGRDFAYEQKIIRKIRDRVNRPGY
jgi:hypothetical protein